MLALLMAGGALLCYSQKKNEPVYKNKTLSQWLSAQHDQDALAWWTGLNDTSNAICAMGTNAVPCLLMKLSPVQPSKRRLATAKWLREHHLKRLALNLYDPYTQDQSLEAASAFSWLRPEAKDIIPILLDIWDKPNKHPFAYRRNAIITLGMFGPAADGAIPFLLTKVVDTNVLVQEAAFSSLGDIHARPDSTIPVLIKGLRDPDVLVRIFALDGLALFASDATQAIPDLNRCKEEVDALYNSDPNSSDYRSLKFSVENALRKIKGESAAEHEPIGTFPSSQFQPQNAENTIHPPQKKNPR